MGAVRSRRIIERNTLLSGLEVFRENIRSGVDHIVAKHLYRAGVYFASLDKGLARNPSVSDIINSVRSRLGQRDVRLFGFLERNMELVLKQGDFIEAERLLRGILRQGGKAAGLLEGNGERELQEARRALERLDRLERYLSTWREGLLSESAPYYLKVVDMHD